MIVRKDVSTVLEVHLESSDIANLAEGTEMHVEIRSKGKIILAVKLDGDQMQEIRRQDQALPKSADDVRPVRPTGHRRSDSPVGGIL